MHSTAKGFLLYQQEQAKKYQDKIDKDNAETLDQFKSILLAVSLPLKDFVLVKNINEFDEKNKNNHTINDVPASWQSNFFNIKAFFALKIKEIEALEIGYTGELLKWAIIAVQEKHLKLLNQDLGSLWVNAYLELSEAIVTLNQLIKIISDQTKLMKKEALNHAAALMYYKTQYTIFLDGLSASIQENKNQLKINEMEILEIKNKIKEIEEDPKDQKEVLKKYTVPIEVRVKESCDEYAGYRCRCPYHESDSYGSYYWATKTRYIEEETLTTVKVLSPKQQDLVKQLKNTLSNLTSENLNINNEISQLNMLIKEFGNYLPTFSKLLENILETIEISDGTCKENISKLNFTETTIDQAVALINVFARERTYIDIDFDVNELAGEIISLVPDHLIILFFKRLNDTLRSEQIAEFLLAFFASPKDNFLKLEVLFIYNQFINQSLMQRHCFTFLREKSELSNDSVDLSKEDINLIANLFNSFDQQIKYKNLIRELLKKEIPARDKLNELILCAKHLQLSKKITSQDIQVTKTNISINSTLRRTENLWKNHIKVRTKLTGISQTDLDYLVSYLQSEVHIDSYFLNNIKRFFGLTEKNTLDDLIYKLKVEIAKSEQRNQFFNDYLADCSNKAEIILNYQTHGRLLSLQSFTLAGSRSGSFESLPSLPAESLSKLNQIELGITNRNEVIKNYLQIIINHISNEHWVANYGRGISIPTLNNNNPLPSLVAEIYKTADKLLNVKQYDKALEILNELAHIAEMKTLETNYFWKRDANTIKFYKKFSKEMKELNSRIAIILSGSEQNDYVNDNFNYFISALRTG